MSQKQKPVNADGMLAATTIVVMSIGSYLPPAFNLLQLLHGCWPAGIK